MSTPTTEELLATLERCTQHHACEDGGAALAELGHRMGAMARAMMELKRRLQRPETFTGIEAIADIDAALTDVAAVYTSEEVAWVVTEVLNGADGYDAPPATLIQRRLAALRGGGR